MSFFRAQLGFVFYGLIIWLPLGIVLFLLFMLLGNLDSAGRRILGFFAPPGFPIYPGYGLLLGILLVYVTGLAMRKTSIGRPLSKIPVLGMLFADAKGGTMSLHRLANLNPCLFLLSPTCPSYGWILSEEPVRADGKNDLFRIVNVYYPNVPTMLTGQVYPVRKETVLRLGNTSNEVFDLLLYSLRCPECLKVLPWSNEQADTFLERARRFGITPAHGVIPPAGQGLPDHCPTP
ncbi:MAG: hypothetical protein HYX90_06915 [Chloroflexi bacterium]|nr:hypothetical protein [Chloroflexota bacterium]